MFQKKKEKMPYLIIVNNKNTKTKLTKNCNNAPFMYTIVFHIKQFSKDICWELIFNHLSYAVNLANRN